MSVRTLMLISRGRGGLTSAPPDPEPEPEPEHGLQPGDTIGATRLSTTPTFNFNALPENQILVGSTYWCAYQPGQEGDIALASSSSPDGPWTGAGTKISASHVYAPCIFEDAGTFYLYFGDDRGVGGDGKMYVATASTVNGTYAIHGSPTEILDIGTAGQWDDYRVGEPSVVKHGSTYYMFYMGERSPFQSSEQIGLATASSPTGPWTRSPSNPILGPGTSGQWDDFIVADPDVIQDGDYWWMWYSSAPAGGGTPWGAGLAYASDPSGPWTRHADNPIMEGSGSGFDINGSFRGGIYVDDDGYHVTYTGLPSGSPNLGTMKGGNAVLVIT